MDSAVSRRYAKALFDLAVQAQILDQTRTSLQQLTEVLTHHPDLSRVCLNPIFNQEEQWGVLAKVLSRLDCPSLIVRFVHLLVVKHRLAYLSKMNRHFMVLVDESQGRQAVRVQTPREMSDRDRDELRTNLEEALGQQVILSVELKPELIAGITVQVGTQVFDGTIRGRLNGLRRTLSG